MAKPVFDLAAKKRPVNLTLNEDVVARAEGLAGNLSAVVESLLADYVARAERERAAKADQVQAAMDNWNNFAVSHGSFADEHSTL